MPQLQHNEAFFYRLYGKIEKPKRVSKKKTKTFADYFAMSMVLPHSLLCGAMAIAGMILFTGVPWLAIAAGLFSFAITYIRLSEYTPQLFRKIPRTLFKEINEKGVRTNQYITEYDRLILIGLFIFILTATSAFFITFFSLSLMKDAFIFLGIKGIMSFGGWSLIPASTFFGLACFLCTWSMFSDNASNMFARKNFWDELFDSAKQLFGFEPDPSLLLPGENLNSVGNWMLARQILRLLLVLSALALITYGNYVVGMKGVYYMFEITNIRSAPWELTEFMLPACILMGSGVFIVTATKHLMTLLILTLQFAWQQFLLPIDHTVNNTLHLPLFWRISYITAAILAAPFILIARTIIHLVLTEYRHLQDTLVSPDDVSDEDKHLLHDTNTLFNRLRCNTDIALLNLCVNTLFIFPITFILGVGIFLSQHVKLFATINAINTGAMAFNTELPIINNYLGMTGYFLSSLVFGYSNERIQLEENTYNRNENLTTVLFKFTKNKYHANKHDSSKELQIPIINAAIISSPVDDTEQDSVLLLRQDSLRAQ